MDAIRFDDLTKAWIAEASRRRTLAGMLAALAALGLATEAAGAAKSGKCKKPCGQCQFCKKGTCQKKDGKKRCKKGKCKPEALGTPCGGDDCGCGRSIEGDAFCAADAIVKCDDDCANSGECAAGRRCVRCGAGGDTACVPECGTI